MSVRDVELALIVIGILIVVSVLSTGKTIFFFSSEGVLVD